MLNEIITGLDKVKEKHKKANTNISNILNKLQNNLKECENKLKEIPESENQENINKSYEKILNESITNLKSMNLIDDYNNYYNNFYGSLSKLGKIMVKNFQTDNNLSDCKLYSYDKSLFNTIILKDLYRRGDFETSDALIKDANLNFDQNYKFVFQDLNLITRDLKDHNIKTLHDWCLKYKTYLESIKSNLFFEVLKLEYILMLNDNEKSLKECVQFAKKEFAQFMTNKEHYLEISKLMTLLIFRKNEVSKSPYTEYNNIDNLWKKVSDIFINNCCTYLSKNKILIIF
jgi:hypothetical protein